VIMGVTTAGPPSNLMRVGNSQRVKPSFSRTRCEEVLMSQIKFKYAITRDGDGKNRLTGQKEQED
jgi:hypothetical protein